MNRREPLGGHRELLFLKKLKSQRRIKPSMIWPAGFLTTVTVAVVLCDMSVSDELCKLAELSLRADPLVLLDSVTDNVLSCGRGGWVPPIGLDSETAEMVFDSAFNCTDSSDAMEMVIDFASVLYLNREDSFCMGLEISCEECESSLSDGSADTLAILLAGGCSAFGFCTSRSFSDSITASINI